MKGYQHLVWLLLCLLALSCQKDDMPQGYSASPPPAALEPVQLTQLAAGIHEQTAALPSGGTLRYTVSVPDSYDPKTPVPVVVALHYGGEVTPFYGRGMIDELVEPALHDLEAVVISPDSLGGDWTSSLNEQAVVWLTRSVMKGYAINPKQVLLTGFSMGGKGTWFIGSRNQDLFTVAIPIAGEPAGGLDWKIPIYAIHSSADEVVPIGPARSHVDNLKARGVTAEFKTVAGPTHYQTTEYAAPLKDAVPWLLQVWK